MMEFLATPFLKDLLQRNKSQVMYKLLQESISQFITLENQDFELLKVLFHPLNLKKDFILVHPGQTSRRVYFVNSGYLRYFKINDYGEEQTIHLYSQGEFATVFSSFTMNTKSEETLHLISEAELLYIEKEDLEALYNTEVKWQIFGRKIMESLLLVKEQRIIDQLSLSAQQRYLKLIGSNPDLVQNVPVQYLASYIGIQPESLSRIKKQIFLTNVK